VLRIETGYAKTYILGKEREIHNYVVILGGYGIVLYIWVGLACGLHIKRVKQTGREREDD